MEGVAGISGFECNPMLPHPVHPALSGRSAGIRGEAGDARILSVDDTQKTEEPSMPTLELRWLWLTCRIGILRLVAP
jgi:hypothetical protein